jgi:transposase
MERMRKSRLSRYKQNRLIEHFVSGSTALTAASLCAVNRKTAVNRPGFPGGCLV